MSAPETNITTQKKRHRGPLVGMAIGLLFVAGLIIFWPSGDSTTALTPAEFDAMTESANVPAVDAQTGSPDNSIPALDSGSAVVTPPAAGGADATE